MSNEVKRRKKSQSAKSEPPPPPNANERDEEQKENKENVVVVGGEPSGSGSWSLDLTTGLCWLTLAVCGVLTWVLLRQNERFSALENKHNLLQEKTTRLFTMEEDLLKVSQKCYGVQVALEGLGAQSSSVRPLLEGLQRDAAQLSEWASGSTSKRQHLQSSLAALTQAVGQIEERTVAITIDVTNKVASVRTDVRRMAGVQSEVESLLSQVGALEDKALQTERDTIKRIADLLTASVERVSALRTASELNARAIGQLERRVPALTVADQEIAERLRELESGRARLIRTVTFAGDLKPKVASIRRDFGAFEPRLSDLTLRIGRLAEDLAAREREVVELRRTLANLTAAGRAESGGVEDPADVPVVDDAGLRSQGHLSDALPQTEPTAV